MRLLSATPSYALLGIALISTLVAFAPALTQIYGIWNLQPEYSYGIVVPPLSAYLIWRERDQLASYEFAGSWYGLILIVLGLALRAICALSYMPTIMRYGFLLVVYGVVLSLTGPKLFRRLWTPLLLLIFMIPLPSFFTDKLTLELQLLSSTIGVWVIRAVGISVYLEGNVIDLGSMQLEVAEACSGLRYLFPLMTLALLVAYMFRGPLWKRATIFLSSVPITVLMNSLRIGVIAITVEYWGRSMAEGVLHDFEGWLVFMFSTAELILVAYLLARIGPSRVRWRDAFQMQAPQPAKAGPRALPLAPGVTPLLRLANLPRPFFFATAIVTAAAIAGFLVPARQVVSPAREDFSGFPMQLGGWTGQRSTLEPVYLDALQLDDYVLADYRDGRGVPINFYSAYYSSQDETRRAHSPNNCIPGGGWEILTMTRRTLHLEGSNQTLPVNRAVIQHGDQRDLVYYWFQERGRVLTDENIVKWYLFRDGLLHNRTDGALVRLVAPLPRGVSEYDVDAKLQHFVAFVNPYLGRFIPD
jgi:exosortase D (VPLPA-CTERM-specific)